MIKTVVVNVPTLNVSMSGAKGVSFLGRFFCPTWRRGNEEDADILSSSHHFNFFSLLLDAVVIGPGLQLHRLEIGMLPKQENVDVSLTFISESIRA